MPVASMLFAQLEQFRQSRSRRRETVDSFTVEHRIHAVTRLRPKGTTARHASAATGSLQLFRVRALAISERFIPDVRALQVSDPITTP